jgi:hypothetical protein
MYIVFMTLTLLVVCTHWTFLCGSQIQNLIGDALPRQPEESPFPATSMKPPLLWPRSCGAGSRPSRQTRRNSNWGSWPGRSWARIQRSLHRNVQRQVFTKWVHPVGEVWPKGRSWPLEVKLSPRDEQSPLCLLPGVNILSSFENVGATRGSSPPSPRGRSLPLGNLTPGVKFRPYMRHLKPAKVHICACMDVQTKMGHLQTKAFLYYPLKNQNIFDIN